MAKTHDKILDDWIVYLVSSGRVASKEEIQPDDMKRLVEASKRYERVLLMKEIGDMPIKE